MSEEALKVICVIGSLHRNSVVRGVIQLAADRLRSETCQVDVVNFESEPLALFNPETSHQSPHLAELRHRVNKADVILLGTPDYHGSMSGALKNFLDHFWHEFAGKLFVTVVASHEKGLTVSDQLRTVARQCYAWALPYGVSFAEGQDFKDGEFLTDQFKSRFEMMLRDLHVYGHLLARQRRLDLAGHDPGFMARHRKKSV